MCESNVFRRGLPLLSRTLINTAAVGLHVCLGKKKIHNGCWKTLSKQHMQKSIYWPMFTPSLILLYIQTKRWKGSHTTTYHSLFTHEFATIVLLVLVAQQPQVSDQQRTSAGMWRCTRMQNNLTLQCWEIFWLAPTKIHLSRSSWVKTSEIPQKCDHIFHSNSFSSVIRTQRVRRSYVFAINMTDVRLQVFLGKKQNKTFLWKDGYLNVCPTALNNIFFILFFRENY